jgi:predicted phosphodiesterase
MKIRLYSDLHLEKSHKFDHIWTPSENDKETILLLAGDIHEGTSAYPFVRTMCENFKHVLYIHGNHEYYDRDYYFNIEEWQRLEQDGPKNFHYLHNDWRILDGVRFLGGTMWTSFDNADPMAMRAALRSMNDYEYIHCQGEKIRPSFIFREHIKFMGFLEEKLEEPFEGKTVVMTHHSPGNVVKRNGRISGLDDHCYYADLEHMIGNTNIALWVHGHTHQTADYMINETRVVCNPYGYHGYATNRSFDKDLILEV